MAISVSDLQKWIKVTAIGRSSTYPDGWIKGEDLLEFAKQIDSKEPLNFSFVNDYVKDSPPINPLWKKWLRQYPPIPKPEYSQVCDGYSCTWCGRCPHGDHWKCPEEDLEEYREYVLEYQKWQESHPNWLNNIVLEVNVK